MGNVPKPLLVLVTLILLLCVLAGFGIGFLPTVRHAAPDAEEVASSAISSLGAVEDAQPLIEPAAPAAPKPKAAASDTPAASSAAPLVTAAPLAIPPVEAAPGAPVAPAPIAPQPKTPAPTDLPPT